MSEPNSPRGTGGILRNSRWTTSNHERKKTKASQHQTAAASAPSTPTITGETGQSTSPRSSNLKRPSSSGKTPNTDDDKGNVSDYVESDEEFQSGTKETPLLESYSDSESDSDDDGEAVEADVSMDDIDLPDITDSDRFGDYSATDDFDETIRTSTRSTNSRYILEEIGDADDDKRSQSSADDDDDVQEAGQEADSSSKPKASKYLFRGKTKSSKSKSKSKKKKSSKESKSGKDKGKNEGDVIDSSSWRRAFARDGRKEQSVNAALSPNSAQTSGTATGTGKEQKPSVFRYIRSWGKEKSIIDSPHHDLPPPPSLNHNRSRTSSGPFPPSLLDRPPGASSSQDLSLSSMRQRSLSLSGPLPPIVPTPPASSSPETPSSQNSQAERQKSLRQQLLFQIKQYRNGGGQKLMLGETSPMSNATGGEFSSDDNNSAGGQEASVGGVDDADDDSSIDSWEISDDEISENEPVHWHTLPALPNQFCHERPQPIVPPDTALPSAPSVGATSTHTTSSHGYNSAPNYLDSAALTTPVTRDDANYFVREHGVLLQAVLQLLAERDQVGVEGSMDSADNIWKKGPLKKLSFITMISRRKTNKRSVAGGIWKVKYVELRHGNLCYYEDSGNDTSRKTIHLRQADTIIKDITFSDKRNQQLSGYCFELQVQGTPTSIWMASSEEERQAWIRAIKSAMIGEDATTNNMPRKNLDLTPYKESLRVYSNLRESLQEATNQDMYLTAIHSAMKEVASLQVPVEWVREQIEHELSPLLLGTLKPPKFGRSPQKMLKSSISEFWRNMRQTTFSINGLTVPRQSQLASERILGALTRSILEFDKVFSEVNSPSETDPEKFQISELQAVSYARNILLAVLRSKERQDAACAAKYLLENPGLVMLDKPPPELSLGGNLDEPVYMEVSFAGADLSDDFLPDSEEMSGWVWTRTRRRHQTPISVPSSTRKTRHTFAVLSGAMLSYYEASTPRPHGLRGQLALINGSSVKEEEEEQFTDSTNKGDETGENTTRTRFKLCVSTPGHQDRLILFDNQAEATAWKEAIQAAIDSAGLKSPPKIVTTTTTRAPGKMLAKGAERAMKIAEAGTSQGIRAIKGAKEGGIRVIRGAVGMLRQNKSEHQEDGAGRGRSRKRMTKRPSMKMLLSNTVVHGKRDPTVQCVVQTMQTFSIRDPNMTEHTTDHTSDHDLTDRSRANAEGWMSVQAKIYQAFLMSGGPSGRIARGDALVEVVFVETNVEDDDDVDDEDDDLEENMRIE